MFDDDLQFPPLVPDPELALLALLAAVEVELPD